MTNDPDHPQFRLADSTATRPAFVRTATLGDEALLGRLRGQAFAGVAASRGGAMYLERHAAELPALQVDWSDATRRVWLGGIENVELGYLLGALALLPSGGSVGVIEAIYVERGRPGLWHRRVDDVGSHRLVPF